MGGAGRKAIPERDEAGGVINDGAVTGEVGVGLGRVGSEKRMINTEFEAVTQSAGTDGGVHAKGGAGENDGVLRIRGDFTLDGGKVIVSAAAANRDAFAGTRGGIENLDASASGRGRGGKGGHKQSIEPEIKEKVRLGADREVRSW